MHKQTAFRLLLVIPLVCYLCLPFLVKPVQAADIIYIRSNGLVEPVSAPISKSGDTYTLTSDITTDSSNGIVIELSNIVLNGSGYTLQGVMGSGSNGIFIDGMSNVTIRDISIRLFHNGIGQRGVSNNRIIDTKLSNNNNGVYLQASNFNSMIGNNVSSNNQAGFYLYGSRYNNITRNTLSNSLSSNFGGIRLEQYSEFNCIEGNDFTSNKYGIYLRNSAQNKIFHNNLVNNIYQVYVNWDTTPTFSNTWDDAYPSGGNYWHDYTGADIHHGPSQSLAGSDGIGDSNLQLSVTDSDGGIIGYESDRYPLKNRWNPMSTNVTINDSQYPTIITTNATITQIGATPDTLNFTVQGPDGETGYSRVICPREANNTELRVLINGTAPLPPFPTITSDGTYYFIYFEFPFSSHQILMPFAIPEYLLGTILALGALFAAFGLSRRLNSRT